jgi:hypothetical protein
MLPDSLADSITWLDRPDAGAQRAIRDAGTRLFAFLCSIVPDSVLTARTLWGHILAHSCQ